MNTLNTQQHGIHVRFCQHAGNYVQAEISVNRTDLFRLTMVDDVVRDESDMINELHKCLSAIKTKQSPDKEGICYFRLMGGGRIIFANLLADLIRSKLVRTKDDSMQPVYRVEQGVYALSNSSTLDAGVIVKMGSRLEFDPSGAAERIETFIQPGSEYACVMAILLIAMPPSQSDTDIHDLYGFAQRWLDGKVCRDISGAVYIDFAAKYLVEKIMPGGKIKKDDFHWVYEVNEALMSALQALDAIGTAGNAALLYDVLPQEARECLSDEIAILAAGNFPKTVH
jgi:hypothetical protein